MQVMVRGSLLIGSRFFLCFIVLLLSTSSFGRSPERLIVYGDSLNHDFMNWSWGKFEANQTKDIYLGQAAMSFTPSNYSGLYLKKDQGSFSTKEYSEMSLAIKTSSPKPQIVRIGIGEFDTDNTLSILITIQPGEWQTLNIPFSSMQYSIGGEFDKIYIQGGVLNTEGTFFVDEVALFRQEEAAPEPPNAGLGKLRPLSKKEISLSLQDVLLLEKAPLLESFREQNSKAMTFRNSYDVLNDSSNLRGLDREMSGIIAGLDLRALARTLNSCDALTSPSCREILLQRIATHAWRHPLSESERKSLKLLSDELSKLESNAIDSNLRLAITQIFYDPRFLFRFELGEGGVKSSETLSPLAGSEKLAALTYSLSHRPPTYEQIRKLSESAFDKAQYESLVKDLSHSPQLANVLTEFVSQWLMIYGLEDLLIPSVPSWNKTEARHFLDELNQMIRDVLKQSGSLSALVTTPNTQAENQGFGVFGSRAFLTASGKDGQAFMIFRGVRILRNALCQNLPPPPPLLDTSPPKNLDPKDPDYDEKLILQHSSQPSCKGCHVRIDPVGLALQNFDGLGRDRSHQVNFEALGIKPYASVSLGGQMDIISTQNPAKFAESLSQSGVFARCFARQAMRYIVGHELGEKDQAFADQLSLRYLRSGDQSTDSLAEFFQALMLKDDLFYRL